MAKHQKKKAKVSKDEITKLIIEVFTSYPEKTFNYKQISKLLRLNRVTEKHLINLILIELSEKGTLAENIRGKYKLNQQNVYITGKIKRERDGIAWCLPDNDSQPVLVPDRNLNKAMNGDTVKVLLFAKRRRRPTEGEVVEVVKRARESFVGKIEISRNYAFLVPETKSLGYDIFIPKENLNGAKDGQLVIGKINDWPKKAKNPFGEIIEVLGNAGDHETEIHAILAEYGLPYSYPKDVEEIAAKIKPGIEAEIGKRKDFRKITTFTIDPFDAKDFDDALSFRKKEDGIWEVGVHIADVTHYVKPNSHLDDEAFNRATSVYLVDRVVPMLPEHLSNGICSLRPNEEKLTFSAVFEMNDNAEVLRSWVGRTIILSDKRFTYEEAQEVLETGKGEFAEELLTLDRLAKTLRKGRFDDGAISFERTETKFELDEKGKPLAVKFKEIKDSNQLIEEFMLLANRTVAEQIGKKAPTTNPKPKTFIYRIHDQPNSDKYGAFQNVVKRLGYKIPGGIDSVSPNAINRILDTIKGKPEQNFVETLAIRSMAKAQYSTFNIGHFGLSFDHYSHFTSPIRRYPDMIAHRLIQHYYDGNKSVDQTEYEDMCTHCSEREMLAAKAERASIKYKQVEFMADKLGCVYDGIISGVTEWGIYVELNDNKIEGMVPMREMDDDFYRFDEEDFCLRGKKNNKVYRLGDPIVVQILRVNLDRKQLDFKITQMNDAEF